ncbi:hypothetical protein [Methanosarcina horonobensis]|uniref:hypothetical protein n=1 Tax=Methanosarcina horonobensis TaxID=418008 RepID=UPI000AA79914|nr:hypothetical protein [Methanosarcina horonobensis]
MNTDKEILTRLQEIEKRMEKIEATLESINSVLKKSGAKHLFWMLCRGRKAGLKLLNFT